MENNALTGLERGIVLQYLIDGNVPLTVTAVEEKKLSKDGVPEKVAGIFPVALKSDNLNVMKEGIILLKNAPETVKSFEGKNVKVQFYFNKVGLYFVTQMRSTSGGLALVVPGLIYRVPETVVPKNKKYSAVLYFESGKDKKQVNIPCDFDNNYPIFVEPKWSDVAEENQAQVKNYLEKAVLSAKSDGKSIGNGLFLIPLCNFLVTNKKLQTNIEGRKSSPKIIYIDHERIVFAGCKDELLIGPDTEYAMKISFPIEKAGPIKERNVYVLFVTTQIFESEKKDDTENICAVCHYTSIKQEDVRYLYELSHNDEKLV